MVETKFHKLIKLREKLRKVEKIQPQSPVESELLDILEELIQIEIDDAMTNTQY